MLTFAPHRKGRALIALLLLATAVPSQADQQLALAQPAPAPSPAPEGAATPSFWDGIPAPQLTGAQYTQIRQDLRPFPAAYSGPLSLNDKGAVNSTYTAGVYLGWEPVKYSQLYFDMEKFTGAGISNATGLASLTDGDAVRAGAQGLPQKPYVARAYWRQLIPLGGSADQAVARSQDQLATFEPVQHIELKLGILAVSDDFDRNRYANSTRTQFENWSLFNNTAWDFAADTRGYTTGGLLALVGPVWSLRLGIYKMPQYANGQPLAAITQARGQNLELTWASPRDNGPVVRALIYQNVADMGDYNEAIAEAAASGQPPDITATRKPDRHKNGAGLNIEQPLADGGETGLFARLGWDDGHTESFAFTELDRHLSLGAQIDGVHWGRPDDRVGIAGVIGGLAAPQRQYLADGGQGFVLGDGALNYGTERVLETYYNLHCLRYVQLSPDFQYIVNPGFNRDRGPAQVFGVRLHLEY